MTGTSRRSQVLFASSLLVLYVAPPCLADTFGTGEHMFEIEFVTVGEPGNPADTTGVPNPAGSVPYVYRIGKYATIRGDGRCGERHH